MHNTQHADTAHSESHRDMGRLAAEEEGDSEEEQRQMTQHSSDGQGPSNETHGTYLEALTGSTYSTLLSTFFPLFFSSLVALSTELYRPLHSTVIFETAKLFLSFFCLLLLCSTLLFLKADFIE